MITPTANVDGVICPLAEAAIPVLDRGFLYGDSVYEVFRTYQGVPLFLEDHFERLENSARLIHMEISQDRVELLEEIRRTAVAANVTAQSDAYVRYQVTRGEGAVDLYPDPGLRTRYVIIAKGLPAWKASFYERGMDMAIPQVRRNPVNSLDPNIKGGNYLNNIMALTEARQSGADDCVILNREGFVTEAANSNVWFVIKGRLVTPGTGNLKGLTKKHVHRALKGAGIQSEEADVHANELLDVSECFVTSATREVMPCASLTLLGGERLEFPPGGGEVTRAAQAVFSAYVKDYIEQHADEALV
jgi:branched-chain amino acid aminotransferase